MGEKVCSGSDTLGKVILRQLLSKSLQGTAWSSSHRKGLSEKEEGKCMALG